MSQLEARYGEAQANSIIGNCDRHLVLGFQDERTARYFALRANKTPSTLLETPSGRWWLFERGQRGVCEPAYELEQHPGYAEFAGEEEAPEFVPDICEEDLWSEALFEVEPFGDGSGVAA